MVILLVIAGLLLLFGDKLSKNVASTYTGNSGGTSTPVPNKVIPPFYQWNNHATGNVPKTTEAFTPLESLYPVDRLAVPHNNLLLADNFNDSVSTPVRVPISGDLVNATEQTSVAEEQAVSWQNNNVGGSNVRQVLA